MKFFKIYILSIGFCLGAFQSSSQNSEEALKYLSDLTSSLDEFRTETWGILKSTVVNRSSSELERKIFELSNRINAERDKLTSNEGFYGDLSVKLAMRIFLRTSAQILSEDYSEIRDLELHAHHSFKNMESYLNAQNKANDRLSQSGERLDVELKKFAERYDVVVADKKYLLAGKIEKASQAMNYYNQAYLSYFKVYQQKLLVYDALRTEDLELIEEENALLLKFSDESLERLDILDAFMGDESLWNSATAIIKHFRNEALEVYPSAIIAIEKKQIFNMAQKVFSNKPEDERTQVDVDHINSLIDPLNAAIDIQNSQFSEADRKRKILFDNWNSEINSFFKNYLN